MLNNHWPSFFGHLFDYYFKQGGGYFGAKKGLQPVSVVWDYYATGDGSTAHIFAVNQKEEPLRHVNITVRFYSLDGAQKHIAEAKDVTVAANSSVDALTIPRIAGLSSVYFVRAQMTDAAGKVLAENVYWASIVADDLGPASNDSQFETKWVQLANMSALNSMPAAKLSVTGNYAEANGTTEAQIVLTNHSNHIAFFVRTEVTVYPGGNEILPIRYDDNYITIFPGEARTIHASFDSSLLAGHKPSLRVEGYDVPRQEVSVTQEKTK